MSDPYGELASDAMSDSAGWTRIEELAAENSELKASLPGEAEKP